MVPGRDRTRYGTKVCSNGPGYMTKMATMPKYGKHPLDIFSSTRRPMALDLCFALGMYIGPTKFVQIVILHIIQLFGHCSVTWYAMSRSLLKLMEIGISCGRGYTVTQTSINICNALKLWKNEENSIF